MISGNRVSIASTQASLNFTERPDEELIILGIVINEKMQRDSMVAWFPAGSRKEEILLPLRVITEMSDFPIDVNSGDGIATGWFYQPENEFYLNLIRKELLLKNDTVSLPEKGIEAHYDDIYVEAQLLEKWFGLSLNFDFSSFTLSITADQKFSFQLNAERLKRAQSLQDLKNRRQDIVEKGKIIDYKNFALPSFLIQNRFDLNRSPENDNDIFRNSQSLQAWGDILGMGGRLSLSTEASSEGDLELRDIEFNLSRRDPNKQLFGSLQAGKYEIGDVTFPAASLLTGQKRGRGISISSDPELGFSISRNPDDFVIDGEGPNGWEVELYRNGTYVDFQTIEVNGRYEFTNVVLTPGYNLFTIILYGRHGEKITRTQRVIRGPNMLKPGTLIYDVGFGQPDADFIPLGENKRTDNDLNFTVEASYGVNKYITVNSGIFTGNLNTKRMNALPLGVSLSFLGFNTDFQSVITTNNQRNFRAEAQTRFAGLSLLASHQTNTGFTTDEIREKSVTDLTLSRSFGKISTNFSYRRKRFIETLDQYQLIHRLSGSVLGMNLTNKLQLDYTGRFGEAKNWSGNVSLRKNIFNTVMQGKLIYDPDGEEFFDTVFLQGTKKLDRNNTVKVNVEHQFISSTTQIETQYSKKLKNVEIELELNGSSQDTYAAGINISTALTPTALTKDLEDSKSSSYEFVSSKLGNQANLKLRTFIDNNDNNVFDPEDSPIEGVLLKANRSSRKGITDVKGITYLIGLPEQTTRINIEHGTSGDLFLQPKYDHFSVIPRRGAGTMLDIPFIRLGEIEGGTYIKGSDGEPMPGVTLAIIDLTTQQTLETIYSEWDGFFLFPALHLGQYEILATFQGAQEQRKIITLNKDTPLIFGIDFEFEAPTEKQGQQSHISPETGFSNIQPSAGQETVIQLSPTEAEIFVE